MYTLSNLNIHSYCNVSFLVHLQTVICSILYPATCKCVYRELIESLYTHTLLHLLVVLYIDTYNVYLYSENAATLSGACIIRNQLSQFCLTHACDHDWLKTSLLMHQLITPIRQLIYHAWFALNVTYNDAYICNSSQLVNIYVCMYVCMYVRRTHADQLQASPFDLQSQ